MKQITQAQFIKEYERQTGKSWQHSEYGGVDYDPFGLKQTYDEWLADYEYIIKDMEE